MIAPERGRKTFFFLSMLALTLIIVRLIQTEHGTLADWLRPMRYKNRQNRIRKTKPILLLYWSTVFGKPVKANYSFFYVNQGCDQKCELTVDKSRAMEANALIVHARDPTPIPPKKCSHVPFVLHTQENPVFTPSLKNAIFMSRFSYSITYRHDSDFPVLIQKPALTPPVSFKQKSKTVLAAFSHCEKVRIRYLAKLMTFIDVDSYGACLHNKNGLPKRYEKGFKEKKTELSRQYKFTLVFMNADCDYFVDDQLTHALSAGSVPVFMGTDKVDALLPGNLKSSIIKVRDFKSPSDLAKYLKFLSSNESEYNKYLKWKEEGFQFPPNYTSTTVGQYWESTETVFCKLCKRLAQDNGAIKPRLKPDMCRRRIPKDWPDS